MGGDYIADAIRVFVFETIARKSVSEKIKTLMKSFTLAEVLIVLGIIGLIADMTIPTLHQKISDKVTVVKLQKIHSTFENAIRLASSENGSPENWELTARTDTTGSEKLLNILSPYLNLSKNCNHQAGCFYSGTYKYLNGVSWYIIDKSTIATKVRLSDGSAVALESWSPDCSYVVGSANPLKHVCGKLFTDVNGENPPNVAGKDMFSFWITKYGLIPCGTQTDTAYSFDKQCSLKSSGEGCAAWVIYNGNMDYLHCQDLSWDAKNKC